MASREQFLDDYEISRLLCDSDDSELRQTQRWWCWTKWFRRFRRWCSAQFIHIQIRNSLI